MASSGSHIIDILRGKTGDFGRGGVEGRTSSKTDAGDTVTTSSTWQTAASVEAEAGSLLTEIRPATTNVGSNGNDIQVRIIQSNRPGVGADDAPTADDISGDPDWTQVDEAAVQPDTKWPILSGPGIEVLAETIVVQVKDGQGTDDTKSASIARQGG